MKVEEITMTKRKRRSFTDEFKRQSQSTGSFRESDKCSDEENELIQLRKENQQLKMENDILKQAALILGRK